MRKRSNARERHRVDRRGIARGPRRTIDRSGTGSAHPGGLASRPMPGADARLRCARTSRENAQRGPASLRAARTQRGRTPSVRPPGSNRAQQSRGDTSWSCRRHSRLSATLAPNPELKVIRPGMRSSSASRCSTRCRQAAQHPAGAAAAARAKRPVSIDIFTSPAPDCSSTTRTHARTAHSRSRH